MSKQIDNLMAAGSTMSCGSPAMTGLRYCAPSIIQGQAAGTVAAIAAANDIRLKQVDIAKLQEHLQEQGAFVSVKEVGDMAPKNDRYYEIGNY